MSCKGCIGSDPTRDTVKVDPSLMLREQHDKENKQPVQLGKKSAEVEAEIQAQEQKAAEQRRKKAEEESRLRKEQEAAAAAFAEERRRQQQAADEKARLLRQEAEQKRREEVAAAAAREAAAAAAAAVAAEEDRRNEMAIQAAEEKTRRERAAIEAQEIAEAKTLINEWCKSSGFQEMNSQKKTLRGGTKFPLHTAVKHKNGEMVAMMLRCGANRDARDSKKQTPAELAAKLNTNGAYANIVAILG